MSDRYFYQMFVSVTVLTVIFKCNYLAQKLTDRLLIHIEMYVISESKRQKKAVLQHS